MVLLYIIIVQMEIVVLWIAHYNSSSSIHLASSLTIEMISKNNDGGGNHGGSGTIKSIDKDGKVLEVVYDGQDEEDDEDQDY